MNILKKYQIEFLIVAVMLIAIAVSLQSYLLQKEADAELGISYTNYNNYIIFKQSFFHLISGKDLYAYYPAEYYDLYKYSPTFALFMAPIALLPNLAGLMIWNFLNAIVLIIALWRIPYFSQKYRWLAIAFVVIELVTSIQNAQSNALMAGLIIFAFNDLEKNKPIRAALLIVLTGYIKIFGLVALSLFLLYKNKSKFLLSLAFWFFILLLLPLVVIQPGELISQYQSWLAMLTIDHETYYGISLMGCLSSWFGLEISKNLVVAIGAIIFLIPFLLFRKYELKFFRYNILSMLLIWMVIFNHKAESPTYIIAISGVAIWFFIKITTTINLILLLLAFLLTILSPTDIVPADLKNSIIIPYSLKAFPCIIIWLKVILDLLFIKSDPLWQESGMK